jgi:hypothetical protein
VRPALLVVGAIALAPAVSIPRAQDGAASAPASRPTRISDLPTAERRLQHLEAEIAALRDLERAFQAGDSGDLARVEAALTPPPPDADARTRELRDRMSLLEDEFAVAHVEREKAAAAAEIRNRELVRVGPPIPSGPFPHPLAEPDDLRLGGVLFQRGEASEAASVLALADGAEARWLEARALDAADRVEEALAAYARAATAAKGDARLTETVARSRAALEWKARLGRPEDLGARLRGASAEESR